MFGRTSVFIFTISADHLDNFQFRSLCFFFPALMSLMFYAPYLCSLCQAACLPPAFFVRTWSCQSCPISRLDIKEVWGASKSAELRDELYSLDPQLLSLIKPPGWHRERQERAVRGADRLVRKKKTGEAHIVYHSAITVCSLKLWSGKEQIDGDGDFLLSLLFVKYTHTKLRTDPETECLVQDNVLFAGWSSWS